MADRKRARIVVEVDLDTVPGWGFYAHDFAVFLRAYLNDTVPHYSPAVFVERE